MVRISAFIFILIIFLCWANPLFAQEEQNFETKYNVTYTVFENGVTQVNQNITLINKTDVYRPTQYSLELALKNIENVRAQDSSGTITPKVERKDDKTKIDVVFNDVVIGAKNSLTFSLSFETQDLAERNGTIWEVNIPGIENKEGFLEYNATLLVPSSFGNPSFVKPAKSGRLYWTKDEIPRGGILAAFGEYQVYKLNLKYHLKNPRVYSIETEIALPPTTNYQKVFVESLEPRPQDVNTDQDGNWLARYKLPPGKKLTINLSAFAQVFLAPEPVATQEKEMNLLPQKYWEVADLDIKNLANKLTTPRRIYNFIVDNLTYDLNRVVKNEGRVGAKGVLDEKNSAICMEFTDLFVATARAAGIPAREVNGWANAENDKFRPLGLVKDILHAWPEYYDRELGTWVMVDPTWGNTTGGQDYFDVLDFNHLAFVIKGQDSEYPIPAGGYKIEETKDSKDINITFGNSSDIVYKNDVKIEFAIPDKVSSFFPTAAHLIVENSGNAILPEREFTINGENINVDKFKIKIPSIPPYGQENIALNLTPVSLLTQKKAIIHFHGAGVEKDIQVLVSPFTLTETNLIFIIGGILGGTILGFAATRAGRLFILRSLWKTPLRGQSPEPQETDSKLQGKQKS